MKISFLEMAKCHVKNPFPSEFQILNKPESVKIAETARNKEMC